MSETMTDYQITPLGTNPKLKFQRFKIDVEQYAQNQLIEHSPEIGNMAALYPAAAYATQFPAVTMINWAAPIDPIGVVGAQNAAAVQIFNNATKMKADYAKAQVALKNIIVTAMGSDNLASLFDPLTGLRSVSVETIFQFAIRKFGTLSKSDLDSILHNLTVPITKSQSFDKLASDHLQWHNQAAAAGNPISQHEKVRCLRIAIQHRPEILKAYTDYMVANPLLANQNFASLCEYIELQAPNMIMTASEIGYANSAEKSIMTSDEVMNHPLYTAMAAQIKTMSEKLNAITNESGENKKKSKFYCYKHGYNNTHAGNKCKVMANDTVEYTDAKVKAKNHNEVAGGNSKNM